VVSAFVKQDTGTGKGAVTLFDTTASNLLRIDVGWSSGVPSLTHSVGTSLGAPERYRNGWYRISGQTTTFVNPAATNRLYLYPAFTDVTTGSMYFFGPQVEGT
jgi:hypothetical protein